MKFVYNVNVHVEVIDWEKRSIERSDTCNTFKQKEDAINDFNRWVLDTKMKYTNVRIKEKYVRNKYYSITFDENGKSYIGYVDVDENLVR